MNMIIYSDTFQRSNIILTDDIVNKLDLITDFGVITYVHVTFA